jgi:hypothetical protein
MSLVGLGNGSGDASDEVEGERERENWEFRLSGLVMIEI